jgi:hypothetical protein
LLGHLSMYENSNRWCQENERKDVEDSRQNAVSSNSFPQVPRL